MKKRKTHNDASDFVRGLFLDYDGTISPLNVPLSESTVLSENLSVLNQISRKIPVAVITTKDVPFVVKRTPFAHAWSGLAGLEVKIGNTVTRASCIAEKMPYLVRALAYAKGFSSDNLTIEEKRDSEGTTVAFSVDWRQAKNKSDARNEALAIISYCKTMPIVTIEYERQPFFDVFPCPVDKGKALLELKQKLGLHDGVLYMGDSIVDNPAFNAADIAVGVIHEETSDSLVCEYFVKFEAVADLLQSLLKSAFHFTHELPMLLSRTQALQYMQGSSKSGNLKL